MRFIHPDLLASIEAGAVVLTPNALVSAALQRQYAKQQLSARRLTWPQPGIFSVNAWFQQLWRDARLRSSGELPLLLTSAQEQMLWERVIRSSGVQVLGVGATARNAMNAARFTAEWRLPLSHPSWDEEEDTRHFRHWLVEVRELCRNSGWLPGFDLISRVSEPTSLLRFPSRVIFAGFDEPSRAISSFAEAMQGLGTKVEFVQSWRSPGGLISVACADIEDELELAARWARARLEEEPQASIAIFAQNLRHTRSTVDRIFREILRPASVLDSISASEATLESPFYVHGGPPLAQHPVIASALALLEFAAPFIPSIAVTAFLCSPFFAGAKEERHQRALADARLRGLRETELPLRTIEAYTANCPALRNRWPRIRSVLSRVHKTEMEAAEWSRLWRELLTAAGWPADPESLSPLEKEAVQQWHDILSGFDQLGLTAGSFSFREALTQLHSLSTADGRAAGDLSSPIQVLEPQSASSLCFDYVWLTGASELEWPPLSFAPSFIPFSVQKAEGLETASPDGRTRAARRLSENVMRSAKQVVVSFSSSDASAAECSPLFSNSLRINREDLHVWRGRRVLEQVERGSMEIVDDTHGPRYESNGPAPGGTHLLKSQSACPFQAFARWRLNAESLEEGVFSFDARDRGDFLHKALDAVWRAIGSSEQLRSMTADALRHVVVASVEKALSSDPVRTTFRQRLREAESERLVAVILDWLALEARRRGEFTPRAIEENSEFTLSGLTLKIRADRIDELPDKKLVVIDYKSGKVDRRNLDNERPREPQLLVYAAKHGKDIDGLYFASVRRHEGGACGYGRVAHFESEKKNEPLNWDRQLDEWTATVTRLAQEFESGAAPVHPAKGACDYCGIKPICRIQENGRDDAGDVE
jgi:ATP-dependent helicase/nuclease subunit B